MNKSINGRAVGCMRDLEIFFNHTIDGFNNGALSKKNLLFQGQEFIFHSAFDTGDKL